MVIAHVRECDTLVICVFWLGEHISLVICVPG